ncbi:host-nuclease inhibitor Gam family protein [Bacillus sp. FSL L8-0199]|uniref:host-nuclease inhibitor Gam family protein n=1 Tax=Bacillus sp. FSL L8-0199 TaxID=2954616 RepID=UPI0030F966CD
MNSLQAIELAEVDELQDAEKRFEISDLEGLNWAFRKLTALKAEEKKITTLANVERDRIAQWEQKELKPIHDSISFFESHIHRYHAEQLAADPKQKTISTPYGKSKTRKSKETPDKGDEALLLDYVIQNDLAEYIKNSVKWADLKKTLKIVEISGEKVVIDDTGQIVPGVTVKPESISYSVEV